ncbi:MAG: DUF58 domain-containing protein [Planctomycetes bacterium]|nr:DUF58 domain-containing protein [Planctomycetota bacterium]
MSHVAERTRRFLRRLTRTPAAGVPRPLDAGEPFPDPLTRPRSMTSAAPGRAKWRYLDLRSLKKLRNMHFIAKTIVEGQFAGRHRSSYFGFSVEFADYREYVPGDEIRAIDWKAYARSDRHYIKLFEEETDMTCYLLLDKSASMRYGRDGGLSKIEYASYLVAALAYLIVKQGDRVGLTIFDDQVRTFLPPSGTASHLFGMLNALENLHIGRHTDVAESLRKIFPILKKRGLLIVVSDLLDDPERIFKSLSMFRHRKFDVILLHVLHPDELELPAFPNVRFVDAETGESITAEPGDVRSEYRRHMNAFITEMKDHAAARQIDYNLVDTETEYYRVLEKYLYKRLTV